MEEIRQWINSSGAYNDGLELFRKHCRNRILLNNLSRREDMAKLQYELRRLCRGAKPLCAASEHTHKMVAPKYGQPQVSRAELPEALQQVYDRATRSHKVIRVLHEKMKQATSDVEGASLYKRLATCISDNSAQWAILDKYLEDKIIPDIKPIADPMASDGTNYKDVNNARLRLTRNVKKLDSESDEAKREALIADIKRDADFMISAGATFTKLKPYLEKLNIL